MNDKKLIKFDASLYDCSNDKYKILDELVVKEKITLQILEKAIKGSDVNKTIQTGLIIKSSFANLF